MNLIQNGRFPAHLNCFLIVLLKSQQNITKMVFLIDPTNEKNQFTIK